MDYDECMQQVENIRKHLKHADEKTKDAFYYILDGYEQWNHL